MNAQSWRARTAQRSLEWRGEGLEEVVLPQPGCAVGQAQSPAIRFGVGLGEQCSDALVHAVAGDLRRQGEEEPGCVFVPMSWYTPTRAASVLPLPICASMT